MSRRLLAECRSFVRQPDGSTGARAGTHDDRVMAMAIGLAARAELLEKAAGSFSLSSAELIGRSKDTVTRRMLEVAT